MKAMLITLVGLLLMASCGQQYHTLTLTNEATKPMLATIHTDDGQKMSAFSGEMEWEIFEADTYLFTVCITLYGHDTLTIYDEHTIDLDHDMTCVVSDDGAPITWE